MNQRSRPPLLRLVQRQRQLPIEKIGLRRHVPFTDVFHWLMDRDWWELIAVIFGAFLLANLLFAVIYYLLPNSISNMSSFIDSFFFSVQTMATLGYGVMAPKTDAGNAVATIEAFVGLIGFSLSSGVMFGRLARPTAKIMFSQVGVISTRDGRRVFTVRIANERDNQILEGHVTMSYLATRKTKEGEELRRFYDMKLERHHSPVFTLTWTLVHPIDADSPLYNKNPEDLTNELAEILVSFRGIDETFSQEIFARNSYVADEIHWDARFVDILGVNEQGHRTINYSKFHETQPWN